MARKKKLPDLIVLDINHYKTTAIGKVKEYDLIRYRTKENIHQLMAFVYSTDPGYGKYFTVDGHNYGYDGSFIE